MLKFLCIGLTVALGVVLSIPMEMTTLRPEATTEDTSGRLLTLPDPVKCENRPKHFEHDGHHYWFSGKEENFTDHKVDWLDGRNICREYCMDLVSLETPSENDLIEKYLIDNDLPYIWTAGRLCNFKGCDREDLQPPTVNGWFWSGSGVKMAPTNSTPPGWSYQPWSYTGHKTQFEGKNVYPTRQRSSLISNGSAEPAVVLLTIIYDVVVYEVASDIACYHNQRPFICDGPPTSLPLSIVPSYVRYQVRRNERT
eukprot:TRINITY_DN7943_c0_g1_i1.p1 TRINITY_DN7943_c0_g1~~TRINITY_DN7943_c0_g1_i1.p1  ORF type:complete len:254 (+),score=12.30 TRINITY_DN7943_c0_g1_i1:115-876(+)